MPNGPTAAPNGSATAPPPPPRFHPSNDALCRRSASDDAIVAATIDMAHALGMVVAAEGVETEEQLFRLQDLGCDRAQGFYLAMPEVMTPRRLVLIEQRPG